MAVEDQILTKELLKRILGNLGAVPGDNFGKVGITRQEFALQKHMIIQEEDKTKDLIVYAGESKVDNIYQTMLVNTGTIDEPEFILMIKIEDGSLFGFQLPWVDEKDPGMFMIYANNTWQPISLLYKLNLTAAVEMMTQQGVVWYPCSHVDELYEQFTNLVDFA